MPPSRLTEHRTTTNTALPYISNSSITSLNPQFIQGSQNLLTGITEWFERRPGFSQLFTSFGWSNLQRNFLWRKWNGSFFWMGCDIVTPAINTKTTAAITATGEFSVGVTDFTNMEVGSILVVDTGANQETVTVTGFEFRIVHGRPLNKIKFTATYTKTHAAGVSVVASGLAQVYKLEIGLDPHPILLWSSTVGEPFDFIVSNDTCYFGNGTDMKKYDGTALNNWGIATPTVAPTISLLPGSMNIYTSKCWCYTYWDGKHESSPSAISACSGVFTSKTPWIGVTASSDPQVTGIRIYATPDGGAQDPSLMQEITGSPFPNTTMSHADTTLDTALSIRVAPPFYRNDPPTPSKGFVAYGGRIWSFKDNKVYYSAFEETADDVPEECWPSGLDGNFYPWANSVDALAPLLDGIAVFNGERISKVEGDSLDTFRRYTLLEKRGTRNRNAVAAVGGSVAWFDTAGQVWASDLGEVGLPIRPDTAAIDQSKVELAVHISGIYHWLVLLDGAQGRLYVFDLDRRAWMPPWTVGTTASALFSGETSLGVVDLLMARNQTRNVKLVSGSYEDDGNPYVPIAATNMYRLTPDNNPSWKGVHDWTEIKTDSVQPEKAEQLTDNDPRTATYLDITANALPTPDIIQGTDLESWRYTSNFPVCQFLGMKFTWAAENRNLHVYQIDIAFHQYGE